MRSPGCNVNRCQASCQGAAGNASAYYISHSKSVRTAQNHSCVPGPVPSNATVRPHHAVPLHLQPARGMLLSNKSSLSVSATSAAHPDTELGSAAAIEAIEQGNSLQELLVWLVNNGVQGIGADDSLVALYEDMDGDRGVIAAHDIPAGQQLLRVPLRLAITDVMDQQARQQLLGQGEMWQDRLVAKLLQHVQQGKQSPWYPYIQALPRHIPSALQNFNGSDAEAVQLPAVTAAIQTYAEKMAASWRACRPDAIGKADLQRYSWAHSVVMSRTFGNASEQGGIGVRMLVPLIDMLNHAGDEAEDRLLGTVAIARDNVRWDVVSPGNSPNNCWEMVLSTTQLIPADSPLLLSYFEGPNEEFLLHYGFVPYGNPNDTVQLFDSITAALEHLWAIDIAQGTNLERLAAVYKQAHDASLAALQAEVMAAAGSGDTGAWTALLDALEPVKVASGGRVSGPLIAALEVLHEGHMKHVEAAVAGLCWQQLQAMPTSLLQDLALLVADAQQADDGDAVQLYGGELRHYLQVMVPTYAPHLLQPLAEADASSSSAISSSRSNNSSSSNFGSLSGKSKKRPVPGPLQVTAVASTSSAAAPNPAAAPKVSGQSSVLNVISKLALPKLAQAVLHAESSDGSSSSSAPLVKSGQPGSTGMWSLSPNQRMAVKFRVSKKQLLMGVVLAAAVQLDQLEHQQTRAAAALQTSQAAVSGSSQALGIEEELEVLPWHL